MDIYKAPAACDMCDQSNNETDWSNKTLKIFKREKICSRTADLYFLMTATKLYTLKEIGIYHNETHQGI